MTDKDSARQQIQQLVAKFAATPKREREGYTEQQTRVSYILPLFKALGWDTESPAEMSAEEQISRGFVDFGFYLNGVPAFYLETKRVREGVSKPEYMKQAINYSYLKGVTWAVLTDFEDLMVFNAEWEDDDPEKTRFLNLNYSQYANGGFDDLWLLAKPSLLTREIDRAAERFGKKAKREPVTTILFKQLTDWRYRLFQNISGMKTTLWASNPREVDNAVQKLIDRLIFIRSMEDREIEPQRLRPLLRQTTKGNYFPELIKLFHELDGTYNSNLFAQSNLDLMELHDPDLLTEIINGLYKVPGSTLAQYNFNAIDADVLGAVYEQYLGFKAQDPTAKSRIDPRKREKRKAQGIYYTPKFVVRYIVQQTVGRRLAEGADPHTLRILDPACGSGSFLIEAFDVLDRHLAQTEKDVPAAERRQRILRENLFGVDLDDQAVEVTRLNLALRAAYTRARLPYLTNIKHGNSLIDDAAVAGATAFKWGEQFDTIMSAGGFDVVIGNPPYGASFNDNSLSYLKTRFGDEAKTYDSYEMFLIRSKMILKKDGYFSVIIPSSWLTGEKYLSSRRNLLETLSPRVAYAMPFDVFHNAYIDTAVLVFGGASSPGDECLVHYFPKKEKLVEIRANTGVSVPVERIRNDDQKRFITVLSNDYRSIADKLALAKDTFGDVFIIQRGVQPYSRNKHQETDIQQRFLHSRTQITENHLPELQGDELSRYFAEANRKSYLEYSERLASLRPLNLFQGNRVVLRRLLTRQFRLQASYVQDTMITTDNVLVLKPRKELIDVRYHLGILNSKLISWEYVNKSMIAQKDDFPQVHISALSKIPVPAPDKALHDQLVALVDTMLRLKREHAAESAVFSDKRHDLAERIARTDAAIDALVYQLYGLTDEEIKLVEG